MSYPLNFGIYCGMSKQFRDTFKQLIPVTPCTSDNNNRNNGDIRGATRSSGMGGHRRSRNSNNANVLKQVIIKFVVD